MSTKLAKFLQIVTAKLVQKGAMKKQYEESEARCLFLPDSIVTGCWWLIDRQDERKTRLNSFKVIQPKLADEHE